jgi:hypothetical protein
MKFIQHLEPQREIENRSNTGEESREHQIAAFLDEDERREGSRQDDEHKGRAHAHHLHSVSLGVGVAPQEDGQKDEEGDFDGDRKEDAGAKAPVAWSCRIASLQGSRIGPRSLHQIAEQRVIRLGPSITKVQLEKSLALAHELPWPCTINVRSCLGPTPGLNTPDPESFLVSFHSL